MHSGFTPVVTLDHQTMAYSLNIMIQTRESDTRATILLHVRRVLPV
jgi:hypothetical protein